MSATTNRRNGPGGMGAETVLMSVAVGLIITVLGSLYAAMYLGHRLAGDDVTLPSDPFALTFGVLGGDLPWPGVFGWVILAAVPLVLLTLGVMVLSWYMKGTKNRSRVDPAAVHLGRARDVESLRTEAARATARRLGMHGDLEVPGVPIGRMVNGGFPLCGSWEDMHLDIWGPRTGKTTSRAIPAILAAPGAVLVTSNKRDVVDATRNPREKSGPVFVFDPQSIAGEEAWWWWNPLSYVTDEVRAARLAGHFVAGSREAGAKTDAYFDNAAKDLLAGLLLAAALDKRPITNVYLWLTRPTETEPATILRRHGFTLQAALVQSTIDLPDKQRAGVYGSAQQFVSCLTNRQVAAWVNPTPDRDGRDERRQFSPTEFVRGQGTLYSLSKEGEGTAGPLVTALTVAVVEAAEELATTCAGGRLATPLLGVLDEAANVCRWKELPNLYSHYGSRGIVLMTILQSWSQGAVVWGKEGMAKLWSASNVKVYGGGVSEVDFLENLSRLLGNYERVVTSSSSGRGQRTTSRQLQRERILEVDDLAALPKGRAIVLSSGNRPAMIETQPWMTGPHAEEVKASVLAHDPQGRVTIDVAAVELAAVRSSLATHAGADV